MITNDKGLLFVLSGPSGVGKGTVCKKLTEENKDLFLSVSATTRKPRNGEIDGVNYYFYDLKYFKELIDTDSFFEWAEFCDNFYGTPKAPVMEKLNQGVDVILEIDVQGALNVKKDYPESILIFMFPPSLEELCSRIKGRGTESDEVIEKRMLKAESEIEMASEYNYWVVNDTIEEAERKVLSIITAEKSCKRNCTLIEK